MPSKQSSDVLAAYISTRGNDFTNERKWLAEKLSTAAKKGVPYFGRDKNGKTVTLAKVHVESVLVDPSLAAFLLNERNEKSEKDKNRKRSQTTIDKYKSDMEAGLWMSDTGEGPKISAEGYLNDGQHTLAAVLERNEPTYLVFQFGLRRETMAALDGGKGRSAADNGVRQGWEYANVHQRVARLWEQYEPGSGLLTGRSPSRQVVQQRMHKKRKTNEEILGLLPASKMANYPLALRVFTYDLLAQHTDDDTAVLEFVSAFLTGENLSANSPIYKAREYVMNGGAGKYATPYEKDKMNLKAVVHAWNKWRVGDTSTTWRAPSNFPDPIHE